MAYKRLPALLERIIDSVSATPRTRENVRGFLTGDPEIHRAITKYVFRITGSKELFAAGMALPYINPALAGLVGLIEGTSSGLQHFIVWLAKEEQKRGHLSPELRRQVLDVLNRRRL